MLSKALGAEERWVKKQKRERQKWSEDGERDIKWHKKRYHRRRDVTEGHSEMEEGVGGGSQHEIWSSPGANTYPVPLQPEAQQTTDNKRKSRRISLRIQTSPHIWWNVCLPFFFLTFNKRLRKDKFCSGSKSIGAATPVSSLHLCTRPPNSIHPGYTWVCQSLLLLHIPKSLPDDGLYYLLIPFIFIYNATSYFLSLQLKTENLRPPRLPSTPFLTWKPEKPTKKNHNHL